MTKFKKIRPPFVFFSFILSIGIHIGLGMLLLEKSLPVSLFKNLPSFSIQKPLVFVEEKIHALLPKQAEEVLEESLDSLITPPSQSTVWKEKNEKVASKEIDIATPKIDKVSQITQNDPFLFQEKEEALFRQTFFEPSFYPKSIDEIDVSLSKEESRAIEEENEELEELFLFQTGVEKKEEVTNQSKQDSTESASDFFCALEKLSLAPAEKEPRSLFKGAKMAKECFSIEESSLEEAYTLPSPVEMLTKQWIERKVTETHLEDLEYYGIETLAAQMSWEENIDVEVKFTKDPSGEKYLFSLDIHPEMASQYEPMPQNFYFLIESPSVVDKHKFARYKRAVQRALSALVEGDHFNICILDKKLTKFSASPVSVSPQSIKKAEEFLEYFEGKGGKTDLLVGIDQLVPSECDPKQLYSLIFLSDGKGILNKTKQKNFFSHFTTHFENHLNIYPATSAKGNDLIALDLLSYTTGGKTLYSDTNAALPRKLFKLVKDLHGPLIKDLSLQISVKDPKVKVALHPPQTGRLPPLFVGQPYTVFGSVTAPCNFTLLIEGRNNDRQINLQKSIVLEEESLETSHRGLEKEWTFCLSRTCYDHFLTSGKTSHLNEAKQLVAPYHGLISIDQ